METTIYIDGFNFYYGAVKDTSYKWLDFMAMFKMLLQPHHNITKIKYFTAKVSGKRDPGAPLRQKTFIRALQKHIPELEVRYGLFLSHPGFKPLVQPISWRSLGKNIEYANVQKTEEKGSDVNLSVHLVNDAWLNAYECAVVVSNDTDLAEAMRLVKLHHPKKLMGLISPLRPRPKAAKKKTMYQPHPARILMKHADFQLKVRSSVLAACQLPDPIPGTQLRKPTEW